MTREEAIELLSNDAFQLCMVQLRDPLFEDCYEALCMAIKALQQEKRGKWIDRASELDADFRRHDFVCSECAHTANYFVGGSEDWWDMEKPKYCPNCGARMESDGE